jgi:hypothetical protein
MQEKLALNDIMQTAGKEKPALGGLLMEEFKMNQEINMKFVDAGSFRLTQRQIEGSMRRRLSRSSQGRRQSLLDAWLQQQSNCRQSVGVVALLKHRSATLLVLLARGLMR